MAQFGQEQVDQLNLTINQTTLNRTLKAKPSTRDLHKEIVTITVSSQHATETFLIHKQLLMYHSTYFRARLASLTATDNNELTYNLPDVEVFHWFEHWLYHSALSTACADYARITCLYIFAEAIGSSDLQNACLDRLFEHVVVDRKAVPCDAPVIQLVWTQTVENSAIRQLLLDLVAWNASEHEMGMYAKEYPADFSARLLGLCMARLRGGVRGPAAKGKASYHVIGLKVEEMAF
ncbi:hypothetical protein MMC30_000610 [Trapelia coarctata]|nr:hypothetical protein [Trapelia coarctata]